MDKNKKIAIDIVLLLPPEVIEKCVFINSKLDNSDYVSFSDGYNPHITLGMKCIDIDNLEILKNKIEELSKNTESLELIISGFSEDFFSFEIEWSQGIKDLHSSVLKVLDNASTYVKAEPEMFYESEKVRDNGGIVNWINDFATEHSNNKYNPHISIGNGEKPHVDFPIQFFVKKIGIFHLGAHGTCKEKLAEFMLK